MLTLQETTIIYYNTACCTPEWFSCKAVRNIETPPFVAFLIRRKTNNISCVVKFWENIYRSLSVLRNIILLTKWTFVRRGYNDGKGQGPIFVLNQIYMSIIHSSNLLSVESKKFVFKINSKINIQLLFRTNWSIKEKSMLTKFTNWVTLTDKTGLSTLYNPRSNDKQHITIERSGITMIYVVRTTATQFFSLFSLSLVSSHLCNT